MPGPVHVVYCHGFGSTPLSAKAAMIREHLGGAARTFVVPQLDGGDFPAMTMDSYLARAEAAIGAVDDDGHPLVVIGSSLGGYAAALMASRRSIPRADAFLLIAPAFGFTERWRDILGEEGIREWREQGSRPFFHHGEDRELPLGSAFLDSCEPLPGTPSADARPTTIVHGRRDESVPWQGSLHFAEQAPHVDLHLVDDDHRLTGVQAESLIRWCVDDLVRQVASVGL